MTIFQILLLGIYVPMCCLLALYGLHRIQMLIAYLWLRKKNPLPRGTLEKFPTVLMQVPVFNERAVVRRVLGAIERIDYPKELLRVQVLDDSTDDTVRIVAEECEKLRARGMQIEQIRRSSREGFKAGALAHGLTKDDSELVAIFDADFVPPEDFLRRTVPYFAAPGIGMVQARWEHLNLERNLLTRIQTFFLDGHFILEHTFRHRTGRFFNFNGTAGIWRRACIDDAGGWSSNSITEDTEISFRAQLRGWEFIYLRDLKCPAEVPADVDAFKSQQHRWAKGYTEVLKEHMGTIWRAPVPMKAKVEAMLMLSNHAAFLLLSALTILHLPIVLVRASFPVAPFFLFMDMASINLLLFSFFGFYAVSQWETGRLDLRRILQMPLAIGLGMGLMVNSSRAVLEALFGIRTGFVRTPKEGDAKSSSYKATKIVGQAAVEVAFGLYLLASCVILFVRHYYWGVPLALLVAGGFLFFGLSTFRSLELKSRPRSKPQPRALPAQAEAASSGA